MTHDHQSLIGLAYDLDQFMFDCYILVGDGIKTTIDGVTVKILAKGLVVIIDEDNKNEYEVFDPFDVSKIPQKIKSKILMKMVYTEESLRQLA